jgi:hypothetical protein
VIINLFQPSNTGIDDVVLAFDWTWEKIVSLYDIGHKGWEEQDRKSYSFAEYVTKTKTPEKYNNVDQFDFYVDDDVYYPKRRPINLVQNHALVFNYRTQEHIDVTLERFKKYDYVYCTTHDHLSDGTTNTFRIIIPLHKPISSAHPLSKIMAKIMLDAQRRWPDSRFCKSKITETSNTDWGDWFKIIESLINFAGDGCDLRSFDPNEKYEAPVAPEDRIHLAQIGQNTGERLNWEEFEQGDLRIIEDGHLQYIRADNLPDFFKPTPPKTPKPKSTESPKIRSMEDFKSSIEDREVEPKYVPFYDDNGRPLHFVKQKKPNK